MVKNTSGKKAKKAKPKLSPDEQRARKIKRDHIRTIRTLFRHAGFDRCPEIAETELSFEGQAGEFDDAFLHENLLVLVEYTASQSSDVTKHIKNKSILIDKVDKNPLGLVKQLRESQPAFDARFGEKFHPSKIILRQVYCSRYDFDSAVKDNVDQLVYMDFPSAKYFEKICSAVRMSALPEVLQFLRVDPAKVAKAGVITQAEGLHHFHGSILPDSASGFPASYKVVSFYADAASLLRRSYVLRRDGWRGSFQAYQRMIVPTKIEQIRKKLRSDGQVFVNNLIATLPSDVHPVNEKGITVDISLLEETAPVKISLPDRPNSIGLIDGQHRLFSYYEDRQDDPKDRKAQE